MCCLHNLGQFKYSDTFLKQKNDSIEQEYKNKVELAKSELIAIVENESDETRLNINSVITENIPEDLNASVKAIEEMGQALSEQDAEVLALKYSKNYIAYKTIVSSCQKFGRLKNILVISSDASRNAVKEAENIIDRYIADYGNNRLLDSFMIDDNKSPLLRLSAVVDGFLEKDFKSKGL